MVFVVDKALIVMIFMYSISGMVYGGQYLLADAFNFQLISPVTGDTMKPFISAKIDFNNIQTTEANYQPAKSQTSIQQACNLISLGLCTTANFWVNLFFSLVSLITGSSGIFQVMTFFGIPSLIVGLILIPYYLLFFRAVLGYIKSFF